MWLAAAMHTQSWNIADSQQHMMGRYHLIVISLQAGRNWRQHHMHLMRTCYSGFTYTPFA
jgi:hypothetical protein